MLGKYVVTKADGTLTDPEVQYLVLNLTTDPYARLVASHYCELAEDSEKYGPFAQELAETLDELPELPEDAEDAMDLDDEDDEEEDV